MKGVHIAWGADSSAELGIGLKDGFGFPFLPNEDHGNIALIDDIFEEVGNGIEHALGIAVENVLEFIDEDHAHLTPFEQGVQAGDHIPLGPSPRIRVAKGGEKGRSGAFNAGFCRNRDIEIGNRTAQRRLAAGLAVACQPFLDERGFARSCFAKNGETGRIMGGAADGE